MRPTIECATCAAEVLHIPFETKTETLVKMDLIPMQKECMCSIKQYKQNN